MVGLMDGAIIDNKIHFIDRNTGQLFLYDMQMKEIKYIISLYEDELITFTPRKVFVVNNRLYGVSNNSYEVFEYKMGCKELKNCTTYAIEEHNNIVIKEAFLVGNQIWGIPAELDKPILIFEIDNSKVFLYKSIRELLCDSGSVLLNGELEVIKHKNGMLSFTIRDQNLMVEYHLEAKKGVVYNVNKKIIIGAFEYEGDNVWFRSKEGIGLHKWNREAGFIESYELEDANELEKSEKGGKLIKTSNGRLILLPIYSNRVFFLDDNMKSLRSVSGMEGCTHVKGRENATFSIGNIEYQGKLILLPWASNGFIEIDIEDMTADCYDVKMSEKDEVNFYRRTRAYNSLHIESNYFTLSKQLRMLKYETTINSDMNMSYDKNESDGKRIFQYLNKI